jgi:serine/threonine protein kinase
VSGRPVELSDLTADSAVTLVLSPELQDTLEALQDSPGVWGVPAVSGEPVAALPSSVGGWSPGMEVAPHLTLRSMVADGGMGSVWVAHHDKRGGEVAVKLVSRELLAKHPTVVDRLIREAAALTRLRNPNIVRIFEHGTAGDGTPYIVMELLEGVTLWRLVRRRGALSLRDTAAIIEQVCNALSDAHAQGITHRDVKPQNIFLAVVDGALEVKVIDFGIAKEMEVNEIASVTKSGMMVGTPHFMSPEQLLDPRSVDARSDLWSLGVVAYHALTRQLPFGGETLASLFASITTSSYKPPSALVPGLGLEIDAWMQKALARDVKQRFNTARELGVALKRVALASPDAAAPPSADGVEPPDSLPWLAEEPPEPAPPKAEPSSPPDRELLPYPQALMVGYAPSQAPPPVERISRQAKLLVVGAVCALVAIAIVIALS